MSSLDLARYYAALGSEVALSGTGDVLSADLVAKLTGSDGVPREKLRLRGADSKIELPGGIEIELPTASGKLALLSDIAGGGYGNVSSTGGGPFVAGHLAVFSDTSGSLIEDADFAALADLWLAGVDTDDVDEGIGNLYFTDTRADARADSRIAAAIGTSVQGWFSDLDAIGALTTTSFGRGALESVDAAAFRSYIGAGVSNPTLQQVYDNCAASSDPFHATDTPQVQINDSVGAFGIRLPTTGSSYGGGTISNNYVALGIFNAAGTRTFSVTGDGTISGAAWNGTIIPITKGGTGINMTGTGGAGFVLRQSSVGANVTVSQLAFSDLSGAVGSGQTPTLSALSVLARNVNSSGVSSSLAATAASGAVLRESGSTIGWGTIAAAGIASDAVTTAKILDANVTLAKLANIADATLLGNNTGGSAAPVALTASQVKTLLALSFSDISGSVTDAQVPNNITVDLATLATNVTTNANLTGPITSVGNATSIASQTGTGTTFAMSASPTFTGTLTAAAMVGTSLDLSAGGGSISIAQAQSVWLGGSGTGSRIRQNASTNMTLSQGGTDYLVLSAGALTPNAAGATALGSASLGYGALYLDETGAGTDAGKLQAPASIASGVVWTLPDATATLATLALAETLTNKTITSPVISGGTIDNTVIGATTAVNGSFAAVAIAGAGGFNLGGVDFNNGDGSMKFLKSPRMGKDFTTLSNGANNNVDHNDLSFMYISGPTAAFNITGILAPTATTKDGMLLYVYNSTAQNMTLTNESASSTAANRIHTMTGADVATTGQGFAILMYSSADSRWLVVSING